MKKHYEVYEIVGLNEAQARLVALIILRSICLIKRGNTAAR